MRTRLAWMLVPAALLITSNAAAVGPKPPTRQQINAALGKAERSNGLWATINVCSSSKHPNTIGVRGQMPALGFPATLQMVVRLGYYSVQTATFKPVPGPATTLDVGAASVGFHQDGVTFTIKPPATLDATVQFIWRSGHKVLGSTTRSTVNSRQGVQQSDPPGYSSAVCRIT
ncbi:MAG: hypothetical protein ACYDHH_11250 [Solirubrobacteraceae bacterium]